MDRNNSKDFEAMLKEGLRPQRSPFSEDERNFQKNQKADNAQIIGLIRALRSEIKNRLTKNPGLQVNFDPSILNGDPSTMSADALQSMCSQLIITDSAVQQAEAGSSSTVSDFLDRCKDILFGKKCCHKDEIKSIKPIKALFEPPPKGFVITPNVKKKLERSVEI